MLTTGASPGQPAVDADLIECSLRDPERFGLIFHRHFGDIYRYLARRVGAHLADDLAGEVFLIAFARRERYDQAYGSARPWLYGIATNLLAAKAREEQRFYRALARADAQRATPSDEDRVTDRLTAATARPALAAALAGLDPGERDVLLLVALADLSYEEVARALGVPYGTVCSRLSRARKRLRLALGGADPTAEPPFPGGQPWLTGKDRSHG